MRRVLYSVAMSLDGYIARPGGEFDWIPMDPAIDWGAFMSRFDTVLVGRRTFEIAVQGGSGASLPDMRTYVFSRTLRTADHPHVTIVGGPRGGAPPRGDRQGHLAHGRRRALSGLAAGRSGGQRRGGDRPDPARRGAATPPRGASISPPQAHPQSGLYQRDRAAHL